METLPTQADMRAEARRPSSRPKTLDRYDFTALPSLNKAPVMEQARFEYVERRESVIAVGNSGTGKCHIGLGLGLAACQKGLSVGFVDAAAMVHELIEARDEKRLLRLQRQLASYKLSIIDELDNCAAIANWRRAAVRGVLA